MSEPAAEVAELLAAWRRVPDPRLADALDALTARIARPPIAAATEQAKTDAFVAIAKAGDPLDQPRLAGLIGTTRSPAMVEQLEALLAHWAPDPRFTRPFVELLKHPPYHGSGTFSAWRRLFKLFQQYADPRLCELLPALDFHALFVAHLPHANPHELVEAAGMFRDRAAGVARVIANKTARRKQRLADAEVARLVALAGAPSDAMRATELVAEVLANPSDVAAREVLADHLLERDDVRGRFIALQRARTAGTLSAEGIAEEAALLAAHRARWLGDLAPIADKPHFVDGFLAWCELDTGHDAQIAARVGHTGWSTLRGIHLTDYAFPHALLAHPVMANVTQVTGIAGYGAVELLASRDTFGWRRMGIEAGFADLAALDHIAPHATALTIHGQNRPIEELAFLFGPGFERYTTIGIAALDAFRLAVTLGGMLERARPGVELELCEWFHHGYLIRVSGDRRTLDLRARTAWGRRSAKLGNLIDAVAPLAGTLATVRLHDRPTKAERARIEALLAPGGEIIDVDDGPLQR